MNPTIGLWKGLRTLTILVTLVGCGPRTGPAGPYSLWDEAADATRVEIEEDRGGNIVTFLGVRKRTDPDEPYEDETIWFIRSWRDRRTGSVIHQVYWET
jgi:hypothetical protein